MPTPKRTPATDSAPAIDPLADYVPAILAHRANGWTADRQRRFLTILAETGSVSLAADDTGIAPRSAYRLRAHPAGKTFSEAWDAALLSSTGRLLTLAFERATQGIPRDVWRDDKLISSTRQPSDKLMMFLLTNLLPSRFGPASPTARALRNPVGIAVHNLPIHLRNLADIDAPCELLGASDHDPERPKLDPA
ncbi:hypothetical protein ACT009_08065 [Sphingomonas sp. Tas61C01]|uniref:hypothetical protein n=1 Tax=Sphingomonas sp. Tas61C01 TaxID=3458297 RepID=UPI00403E59F8